MLHLRAVALDRTRIPSDTGYPFSLPFLRAFEAIHFTTPVTFLVGENGTGKSTLLAGIAAAIGSIVVGSDSMGQDPGMAPARALARCLRLHWQVRTRKGFFLRAEDFINYAKQLSSLRAEMEQDLRDADAAYAHRSAYARNLAKMPFDGQLRALRQSYGEGLDKQSHGESFFNLFQARFIPGGVYLLDEPETPLSPLKQLSLLALLKDMEQQGGQFLIATHSPILMAYPGATILSFDHTPVAPVAYTDLDHVNLTRDFLNNPDAFLRHL